MRYWFDAKQEFNSFGSFYQGERQRTKNKYFILIEYFK